MPSFSLSISLFIFLKTTFLKIIFLTDRQPPLSFIEQQILNTEMSSKKSLKKLAKAQAAIQTQQTLFNRFYISFYNESRWFSPGGLLESLTKPVKHVALLNKFVDKDFALTLLGANSPQEITVKTPISEPFLPDFLSNVYALTSESQHLSWPAPGATTSLCPLTGLCCYYPLDVASLFPVKFLLISPHHCVLDMCAAPGGKALAISQLLDPSKFISVL